MTPSQKQKIIETIVNREKLRPLGRISRLLKDPVRALPYYILATISHIKPFRKYFTTLWGDKMYGYMPEVNTFYYYGYCEANLTSFLLRWLKEDATFIDVGAHIGFYSVMTSRLVGDKGKIYSFEPTPWTFEILESNAKGLNNVKIYNKGVSDKNETIDFSDYGPGYGAYNTAGKESAMLNRIPKKMKAETVVLDIFCRENNIRPDFIKLDAEGFEYKILSGMKEIMNTHRPLITLEMAGDEKWSQNRDTSVKILVDAGYESYEMANDGYINKCEIKSIYRYTNLLFVPNDKIEAIKDFIK